MRRVWRAWLAAATGLWCAVAQAAWYTSEGSAAVTGGDVRAAREEAINDAIRNLLLQQGAETELAQTYRDGRLVRDQFRLKAAAPIRQVKVVEENQSSQQVRVTVRILMDGPAGQPCATAKVKKTVLPLAFRFADAAGYQGSAGVEGLPRELERLIYDQVAGSPALLLRRVNPARVDVGGAHNAVVDEERRVLQSLGRQQGAQYLIFGNVISAAASEVGNTVFSRMLYARTRTVDFRVTVYDTLSGTELLAREYAAEADWPFKQGEFVDLRSDRFRGSPYGAQMKALCDRAATDVLAALQCRPAAARIVEIEGDEFIINIGSDAGLTPGARFSLAQSYEAYDQNGTAYEMREAAPGSYAVQAVFPHAARLRPVSMEDNLLNVQINDIVTLE